MNTRGTQWDIPKTPQNTNLERGRSHGCIPGSRINTFIDELVSMVNSSTGAQNQGPSSVRRSPDSPRMEASVSTVERTVGAVTPYGVPMEETP